MGKLKRIRINSDWVQLLATVGLFIIAMIVSFELNRLKRENERLTEENEDYKANIEVMEYDYGDHFTKCYWRRK